MTQAERRRKRRREAYEQACDYNKAIMDCQAWLSLESGVGGGRLLGQQMRNRLFRQLVKADDTDVLKQVAERR